jgi:hypothetical protein
VRAAQAGVDNFKLFQNHKKLVAHNLDIAEKIVVQ